MFQEAGQVSKFTEDNNGTRRPQMLEPHLRSASLKEMGGLSLISRGLNCSVEEVNFRFMLFPIGVIVSARAYDGLRRRPSLPSALIDPLVSLRRAALRLPPSPFTSAYYRRRLPRNKLSKPLPLPRPDADHAKAQ